MQQPLDIRRYMDAVPDMDRFHTVDEMNAGMTAIAERFPDIASMRRVGTSTLGEPMHMLSIGNGSRSAFLFGLPHPNEPIGAMMVGHLSRLLCEDSALREALDYTWHLIPCIDPDGTRLNEGWFSGPFDPVTFARHYYRPPFEQQVEWTFPVSYKRVFFDSSIRETQALMRVIDEVRPDFMFSLHNAGFGGVYYYISRAIEPLYRLYHDLPEWEGLPLHLGEPEAPFMAQLAPAIFRVPAFSDIYEYYEANGVDPTSHPGGTSSDEYARKYGTFGLVVEMPYYDNPRVNDLTPTDTIRRDAVLRSLDEAEERMNAYRALYEPARHDLRGGSPMQRAVEGILAHSSGNREAERNWAREAEELAQPATAAELFGNTEMPRFYGLLFAGQMLRVFDGEIAIGNGTPAVRSAATYVRERFEKDAAELEATLEYRVIPIRRLVAVQLGAALGTALYLQEHPEDTARAST